jgi:hypothetical protein
MMGGENNEKRRYYWYDLGYTIRTVLAKHLGFSNDASYNNYQGTSV